MVRKYIYKLKYGNQIYICKHNVSGFEDEGVKFGKASENKGVIKSYTSEFQFLQEDAEFIKKIAITNGFNELLKFEVYLNDFLKGELLQFSSMIDLSTVVIYSDSVTCSLKEGGFITFLDNIMKTEYTIKAPTNALTPLYKEVFYTGNKYDIDIDMVSNKIFSAQVAASTTLKRSVLPIQLKENNNNYNDIRIFRESTSNILDTPYSFVNDNCFIISPEQRYLYGFKLNLNIKGIDLRNQICDFSPTRAEVKYRYDLMVFSNGDEEWLSTSNSLIYSKTYYTNQKYSCNSSLYATTGQGVTFYNIIGDLIDTISGYPIDVVIPYTETFNDPMNHFSGLQNDNYKMLMTVRIDTMYLKDNNGNSRGVVMGSPYESTLALTPNIDIRLTFKNYQIVPAKLVRVYRIIDVYNIMFAQRSSQPYNIQMDLSALENSNLYLTSAGMLCGGIELKTSLEQLLQFIYLATGLRHIVDLHDNVYHVYFEKYENSFKDVEIAKIEDASDIVLETEPDKIYTDVEVGWANKETGIFKSLEYNTINKFRTQYNNIETNTLSLNCQYSASVTDIETIIYNSGYNDKSNDVNNIFVIECYNDNGILRNKQYNGVAPMTLCGNVSLTPKRLLEVHKYELSDFLYHLNVLKFNTSNGKADITLNGVTENTDVTFNNQIMQPFILSFDGVINQSIIKIDARKYGYFTFKYEGNYIRGYIAEGSDSVSVAANGNVSKLRLIVKNNVNL